jgi:citrate lyase beta subunit
MKPNRSILSVPGQIGKMHLKALQSNADVVMLDLEDSVPVDLKHTARDTIIQSIGSHDWSSKTLSVRVNSVDTPYAYKEIVEIVEACGEKIDTIVLPKVNHAGDVHFVCRLLDGIEIAQAFSRPILLEVCIETALGLSNIHSIVNSSRRIKSLVFGIADYTASVGARLVSISGHGEHEEEIYPGHRWHFPLSTMIMAAKAHGLLAIDAPYGNFQDPAGLRKAAAMTCAIGCDGKWAIHPSQVDPINEVFTPSREDIERAAQILAAAHSAQISGVGAIAVDGRMVDQATIRLAKKLWDHACHLNLIPQVDPEV